ncbi:polyprotein [Lettuce waikavirus 1]|uniref:Genome polyprotein n=1 Tax=Lettuce waikavirus 1 TaxID=2749299 RepID=A0A899J5X0_9SECO|nr:polyprotein [Lettuce waikavirus 1]
MQNNNNSALISSLSKASSSTREFRDLLSLKFNPVVSFSHNIECNHSKALSTVSPCICSYCSLLYKLFLFQKKTQKDYISRISIKYLVNRDFISLFNSTCSLFWKSKNKKYTDLDDAKRSINNKLRSEYDCPLSRVHGTNSKEPYNHDSWGVCNNAEHLFECFSACDQAGGEHFPIHGQGVCWHATCSSCGASCTFTSPREGLILAIFLHFLELSYDGSKYGVRLQGTEEIVHCSRDFAQTVCLIMGARMCSEGIEIISKDPDFICIKSTVPVHRSASYPLDFACNWSKRYPKDDSITSSCECDHEFYLTSSSSLQLRLTKEMMRVLMMLIPCDGYMNGIHPDSGVIVEDLCGLINVGGLKGVNARVNLKFSTFHEAFYQGGFRIPHSEGCVNHMDQGMIQMFVETHGEMRVEGPQNCVSTIFEAEQCQQQSSLGTDSPRESSGSRYESEDEEDERAQLVKRAKDFLHNDEDIFVIDSKTSGRGLKDLSKRVGGLLKGVTQCVKKLHAVWDWPLDTVLKGIDGVGEWLDKNEAYVSKDVWACTMCPEVQKKTEEALKDQSLILNMLTDSIKQLSNALDKLSAMDKRNFEDIERRLNQLESRPVGSEGEKASNADSERLDHQRQQITDLYSKFLDLFRRVNDISERPQGKVRPAGFPKPRPDAEIGEQMAIPREKKKKDDLDDFPFEFKDSVRRGRTSLEKQSGNEVLPIPDEEVTKLSLVGGEKSQESVLGSTVHSRGVDEVHNAILADIYLGSTEWNVSSGEGKVLESYALPDAIWRTNYRMANICSLFQYYTCSGLEFTITTTSIGMQGGTLMVAWDSMSCATAQKIDTALQLSNLPFVFLHAASSKEVKFEVSSPAIQHMMCLTQSEKSIGRLGTLKICIINGLNANSETSQKVNINVWVRFKNPKFSFYTVPHDIVNMQSGSFSNIKGISSMEAIVASGKWSTTSSTNLMELTVHPTAVHISNGLVTQTTLSVISHLFNRWSGTLVYKFIFAASMFVRGKVLISAIPVAFRQNKLTKAQITSFPHVVCDLSTETKEFELSVPFISVGHNSLVCRDSIYDVSSYNADLVVSRIHMLILDPLVMTSNASNNISFCVTVRPGEDFALFDLAGVKAEYVDRTLKQSMFGSLTCGKLQGSSFDKWTSKNSVLAKFKLDGASNNGLFVMVSPYYRHFPPCTTLLGWLSQIFVEWSGTLVYTLRAHSHERMTSSYVRIWHDSNASTAEQEEFEFVSAIDPPAGADVVYWRPHDEAEISIKVPFKARTSKLLINKARYTPTQDDWIHYYNGMLIIDLEGTKPILFELSMRAGDDFEMYEQTVAPRCGKVTKYFTKLSYQDKLKGITEYPINTVRLSGPINKAITEPVKNKPAEAVKEEKPVSNEPRVAKKYKAGDVSYDDDGNKIFFDGTDWNYVEAKAEMNCLGCVQTVHDAGEILGDLKKRETISKVSEMVDAAHGIAVDNEKTLPKLIDSMKFLLPMLKRVDRASNAVEDKLSQFAALKDKIMSVLKGMFAESIPGVLIGAFDKGDIFWATMTTLIGGTALLWFSSSQRKFTKRFRALCLIIWSPFLIHKIWDLGKWIVHHIHKLYPCTKMYKEACRSHSNAGTFEGVKESFGSFTEWLSDNWMSSIQSLLTILGVVSSLILWGTIPDGKKLTSFSAKFKEIGDKGRSFSNIFSGFNSITKMCSDWSSTFMTWILKMGGKGLPKKDSALQQIIEFDLRKWVEETREMALQENKFQNFGTDSYIERVRRLYDQSQKIQEAILNGVKMDVSLSLIVKECKEKCTELLNGTYTFKGMKQARIDPIHISMIGAPGVGKSATAHIVINNLLDYMNEPTIDRIYTRCCADAYWSNYHHEPCILYDDLGAINSKLKMSDYAEIMGVKTNDPFSVPMAAVEDKGKHCTSKYVFSCTNILHLDDTGDVVTKNAYYRRRNVLVQVEREEGVAKNEINPTEGLLFTVLGYEPPIGNNEPHFQLKTTWTEDFLRNVNTEGWVFNRVDFRTFLRFLCTYTKAYMTSQENLLKGVQSFRINPFVDDTVVAQAPNPAAPIISLGEMVDKFNNFHYKASTLHDVIKKNGMIPPKGWATSKDLSFLELLRSMCGCSSGQNCNIEYLKARYHDIAARVTSTFAHEVFTLNRLAVLPAETTLNLRNEEKLADLHPLLFFLTLAGYYLMSGAGGICPYHESNKEVRLRVKRQTGRYDLDLDFDDTIPFQPQSYKLKEEIIVWPGVSRLFPKFTSELGVIRLTDGSKDYFFSPAVATRLDTDKARKVTWDYIWINGCEKKGDLKLLVDQDDGIIFDAILEEVEDFGKRDDFSPAFKDAIKQAKDIYGESNTFFTFLLYAMERQSQRIENDIESAKIANKKAAFLAATDKLREVEEKALKSSSDKAKIALAVGGGIVGVGALVGVIFGLKSLISSFVGEEAEEAESEGSAGGASGQFQTAHVIKGKMKPKIVVSTVTKENSAASASGTFKTEHVIKGRKQPKLTSKPEGGFGVTYDDSDLRRELIKEKRKSAKKNFQKAIKEVGTENTNDPTLSSIKRWQDLVMADGTIGPANTSECKGPLKRIVKESGSSQRGEHLVGSENEEADPTTIEAIRELIKEDFKDLINLTMNGTTIKLEKQARVGDFAIVKDKNLTELLMTHLTKMSCMIIAKSGEAYKCFNVLRLTGTFVALPSHYHPDLISAEKLWFICPNKVVAITYEPKRTILVSQYQDLMVWDLGNTVPPSLNYMKHIATNDDWEKYTTSQGLLVFTHYKQEATMTFSSVLDQIELVTPDIDVPTGSYEMCGSMHTIIKGLRYRVQSVPGFCGAAICKADTKSIRKIIGMHVAGATHKGIGYAETLTQESLQICIDKLKVGFNESKNISSASDKVPEIEICTKQSPAIEGKGNLGVIGVVARRALPNLPAKTSICPSIIHGMIGEVKSEPAILSKWDYRLGDQRTKWDPTLDGVKKYGTAVKPFPQAEINLVERHLSARFQNSSNSLRSRKVNTLEIGINGIDGTDFWSPMVMSTSAGYPYVLRKPKGESGKSWLFEELGTYPSGRVRYGIKDKEFLTNLTIMHDTIRRGEVPVIITMECPKDERRKLAKIYDKPATRTFTVLSPEINILFRMYFGDFAAMVMETRANHFSQVGINPETLEWSELMNNFQQVGARGFAGDYAKFDGIGSPDIYHSIVAVVNRWYNDGIENCTARHCLINAIVHRYGLAGDLLMRYSQGMPSGFSMTVIFNSFVNYYYMALAWQSIVEKSILSPQANLRDFDYYTKMVVYGDDNVIAVDDAFLEVFNLQTVASYLSEYGITYTDDAKNPIHLSKPHVPISSVTFLKRSFVPVDNSSMLWKAPLDKISIEERLNWIRDCAMPEEALFQNIDSALYEAAIHSESYFLDLKARVDGALERCGLNPTNHTFSEQLSRWWGNITNYSVSNVSLDYLVELSRFNEVDLSSKIHSVVLDKELTLKEILMKASMVPAARYIP